MCYNNTIYNNYKTSNNSGNYTITTTRNETAKSTTIVTTASMSTSTLLSSTSAARSTTTKNATDLLLAIYSIDVPTATVDKKESPMLGSTSFWIGFCIGAAIILVLILMVYFLCLKFGKSSFCACPLAYPCQEGKSSYEHETSPHLNKSKGSHIVHHTGNLTSMWLESILPGSSNNANETYYFIPAGASKSQDRKLSYHLQEPVYEKPDIHANSENFPINTDSNNEMLEKPNYENGTFYNRKQCSTQERKVKNQTGFDGRCRRHKSCDSLLTDVKFEIGTHYEKPMEYVIGRVQIPPESGKDMAKLSLNECSNDNWKRVSVRSISTPALETPVKIKEESFEFPFPPPPKFVDVEQPLSNGDKEKNISV